MLVRVELVGPSDAPASSVEIECGAGEQILRWIGYTACARLAMDESNLMGIYVPKSISDKHGTLLDPNFVVNEVSAVYVVQATFLQAVCSSCI